MAARKNAFKLTKAEQDTYIKAINALIADGTYAKLVSIHSDMTHRMHTMAVYGQVSTRRFLSWHRAYLLHMEEELQKKEATAFVPYWKWVDGGVPDWLKAFKPKVGIIENKRADLNAPITTPDRIKFLMGLNDYDTFTHELELDPHNQGHVKLGDPMAHVPTAPADPIFWMHHGEVDRVWSEWQAANPGVNPVLTGADATMDPWADTVSSLSSISSLKYSYA